MGAFVLGILVGWLLEWLFFTYWIKGRSTGKFADCSGFKSELSAKNDEISSLKAELANARESASKSNNLDASKENKGSLEEAKENKKSASAKPASKGASSKTVSEAKENVRKKPASSTSASSTKKNTPNKKVAKKAAAKKAPTKKAVAKKSKFESGDDFTKLTGIGPSITTKLHELDITTFQKLSEMDDDILRDMLEASGARLNNNKEDIDSWNEQAALAAKGDFDGLKKLQDSLKSLKS